MSSSFADTPAFQTITDSVAGFGDAASMGGTSDIRELYGLNNIVNTCSTSYSAGDLAGTATSFLIPGGGVAKVESKFARIKLTKSAENPLQKISDSISAPYRLNANIGPIPKWVSDPVVTKKLFQRPKFRKDTIQQAFDNAQKDATGKVICPTCSR